MADGVSGDPVRTVLTDSQAKSANHYYHWEKDVL